MQSISDDERISLRNLMAALQPFRELSERLPLSMVMAFLGVALKEGRSLAEYAADAGFSLSVASRLFADLGGVNRWGEVGFGLIDTRPDGRSTTTKLTPIGSAMVGRIIRSMECIGARRCDDRAWSASKGFRRRAVTKLR
jgi:hypothetical protein